MDQFKPHNQYSVRNDMNKDIYRDTCKATLKKELETLFKTTFIGSVDIIDKKLGHLWGRGIPYSELTDSEKEWREVRNYVRNRILDNGNNQFRAACDKVDCYNVELKQNSIPVEMRTQ